MKSNINRNLWQTFVAILGLALSNNNFALSAVTTNTIHGTAPYFTSDGGKTKITSAEALLGIKLSDGRQYVAPGTNSGLYSDAIIDESSAESPIELSLKMATFADIQTFIPISSYPSVELNSLINEPYNYWGDDDGDNNAIATGNLTVQWQDANNNDITAEIRSNPHKSLTTCDSATPYKLTITTSKGKLSTEYGVPKTSTFNESSHSYYITPNAEAGFTCYAQPNLFYDNSIFGDDSYDLDGPNWVAKKGYKIRNANTISDNFPTTGSNGLYFYLLLAGISPEQAIAVNGSTITAESGSGVTLSLISEPTPDWGWSSDIGKEPALKIVLNGPNENSSDTHFTPSVFKLYSDSNHSHLLYSFKIERWYINAKEYFNEYSLAEKFCQNLGNGYRVPNVEDYTNANEQDNGMDNQLWSGGVPGRKSDYYAQRRLSYKNGSNWVGGLFNEWGVTVKDQYGIGYNNTDWLETSYFTIQTKIRDHGDEHLGVGSSGGFISSGYVNAIACVTP
ncbi:hypothetical protein [Gilliamella sp. GillExp13]|uniref:hypothetical protein n=1 Tax=Gilliamella sp. GillExp13 TaxID=3120243 RepID=UPI00080D916C|nr:hypothetical protein [Gilliamella apicola]OCG58024.1 hypothetical protein A9G37_07255 [Gilliamella apicola]